MFPIPARTPFQGEFNDKIITATPPDGAIGETTLDDLKPDFTSDADAPLEYVATAEDEVVGAVPLGGRFAGRR